MVIDLQGGCRVTQMREGAPFVQGTLSVWNQIGRANGAEAISLRVLELAPGLSPELGNEASDEVLYFLENLTAERDQTRVSILLDDQRYDITPQTGIYIAPGRRFRFDNLGPHSIVFISSQCPEPDPSIAAEVFPGETINSDGLPTVRLADQKKETTADRWYRVLIGEDVGSKQVTQFVGSIPPGRAPDHFHNYEEVLFILRGQGRLRAGESNTPIAPGSCIYLPKGQVHCVENTGDDELRLLGVFYPAGSPSVRYETPSPSEL